MVMELLDKMMDPMRKAWTRVSTRLRFRKNGLVKLHRDVRKCEYEDVHILWEMLKKNETGDATKSAAGPKKVRFWDIIDWAKRAPFICRSV
ncbi:hypothetical protein K7X08_001997 [Anisodus acutangulus]|uniref:Uncharacterized protein n=1 Tax=Anisodus acutangulus TaxID=402998 RepID=A0A9Q1LND2_9SOLA|nr:hypothetical protein K7X08_001997 [Anisodus acutangulus]